MSAAMLSLTLPGADWNSSSIWTPSSWGADGAGAGIYSWALIKHAAVVTGCEGPLMRLCRAIKVNDLIPRFLGLSPKEEEGKNPFLLEKLGAGGAASYLTTRGQQSVAPWAPARTLLGT